MHYGESKVYYDGSHYIAIPHTVRLVNKRPKQPEEVITVVEEMDAKKDLEGSDIELSISSASEESFSEKEVLDNAESVPEKTLKMPKVVRQLTRKELFDELYVKYMNCTKSERKKNIVAEMSQYFSKLEYCESYVEMHLQRKLRNLICRRVRMCRKANLANFNYFCTFTYDDKKHTEESFKKKLRTCFRHLCERRKWKYMGVWERAPETGRLHFHGLFNIPANGLPGEIVEKRDYSTQFNKMQTTFQSTYFNERFGRSDFKEIDENERRLGNALAYLMKYIEKTGEKIVYSKNLPQYFISDILEDDIVCTIGQEDKKLLLFDNFTCLDEGVVMGKVSPEVIEQMRKCNN